MTKVLKVTEKFSRHPGGRYYTDGPWSGQEFLEEVLAPAFDDAVRSDDKLVIDFDGVAGLPTSFLEEAFGGLVRLKRDLSLTAINRTLELATPTTLRLQRFIELAKAYMRTAELKRSAS